MEAATFPTGKGSSGPTSVAHAGASDGRQDPLPPLYGRRFLPCTHRISAILTISRGTFSNKTKNKSLENELKEKEGIIDCLTTNWCTGLGGDCKTVKEFYHIINTTLQPEDILEKINKYHWGLDLLAADTRPRQCISANIACFIKPMYASSDFNTFF